MGHFSPKFAVGLGFASLFKPGAKKFRIQSPERVRQSRRKGQDNHAGKGKTITPERARQSRREGCESAPPGCFFCLFCFFYSRSALASERSARRKTDQRYRQSRKRGFGARRDESGETYKICTKKTEYSLIFYIKMGLTSTRKCGIIT